MARPSKYTPELSKRIAQYISDGLTVRDACYGAGISEDTFCRWRKEKPEFNEAINKATRIQTWSSEALARTSEYRRYIRKQKQQDFPQATSKGNLIRLLQNKPILSHFEASEKHIITTQQLDSLTNLPIKAGVNTNSYGELVACDPYVNSDTNCVEWVDKYQPTESLTRRICARDVWARKHIA